MIKVGGLFLCFAFLHLCKLGAQQNIVIPAKDGFIGIATDAPALGQGDIGVATSPDAFSLYWNPSKYIFSDEILQLGYTQILASNFASDDLSQLNINFHKKLDENRAYAFGVRTYAYSINQFVEFGTIQDTHEVTIDGSYALRLSNTFSMSVGGRFISLKGKATGINYETGASSLYGIDISGYYYGNEIAYKKFNGRFKMGFNFSNLRGRSATDKKYLEIYAPTTLRAGAGFDFIFNQDNTLGVTTEYKLLLNSYVDNADGEPLDFGLEGSVAALGFEFVSREKLAFRAGYSHGINRLTDSFGSMGAGFRGRYADIDIAFLLGLSEDENLIREKLRISLSLDLAEVLLQ